MTTASPIRWLASVTCAGEAEQALRAGADLIDAKDARSGALGALPLPTVRSIVAAVSARAPVSATLGDRIAMDPAELSAAAAALAATGVDLVKIGLFPHPALADCLDAMQDIARSRRLIAVVFADRLRDYPMADPLRALPPRLAAAGWFGVMLDTADKRAGGLPAHCRPTDLGAFVAAAHRAGLHCGLAGSLGEPDIAPLARIGPDILGFRGALCRNGARATGFDPARLDAIARAMHRAAGPLRAGETVTTERRTSWTLSVASPCGAASPQPD